MAHTHTRSPQRVNNGSWKETQPHPQAPDANDRHPDNAPQDGAAELGMRENRMRRAEEMVDRMGERIGHYTTVAGHGILWFAARAREEVEDIWAEAQHIRRRKGS
jgi:hypothetical protein